MTAIKLTPRAQYIIDFFEKDEDSLMMMFEINKTSILLWVRLFEWFPKNVFRCVGSSPLNEFCEENSLYEAISAKQKTLPARYLLQARGYHGRKLSEEFEMLLNINVPCFFVPENAIDNEDSAVGEHRFYSAPYSNGDVTCDASNNNIPYTGELLKQYSRFTENLKVIQRKDYSDIGSWTDSDTFRLTSNGQVLSPQFREFNELLERLNMYPSTHTTDFALEFIWTK